MSINKISPYLIGGAYNGDDVSLYQVLISKETIPLSEFKYTSDKTEQEFKDAINTGVSKISSRLYGTLEIPPRSGYSNYTGYLKVLTKDGNPIVNTIIYNYRYPINSESSPYLGRDWIEGDIVYNTDITNQHNKCIGWVCIEAGTPGVWESFGYIKPWYTQIEKVEDLPDASERMLGRQVLYKDPKSNVSKMYYCINVSGEWIWQDGTVLGSDLDKLIKDQIDPLWKNLEDQLDENLSERVDPLVEAYLEKNPTPHYIASNVNYNNSTNNIEVEINAEKLPSIFSVTICTWFTLYSGISIYIKSLDQSYPLYTYSGERIKSNTVVSGTVFQVYIDNSTKKAYIPVSTGMDTVTQGLCVRLYMNNVDPIDPNKDIYGKEYEKFNLVVKDSTTNTIVYQKTISGYAESVTVPLELGTYKYYTELKAGKTSTIYSNRTESTTSTIKVSSTEVLSYGAINFNPNKYIIKYNYGGVGIGGTKNVDYSVEKTYDGKIVSESGTLSFSDYKILPVFADINTQVTLKFSNIPNGFYIESSESLEGTYTYGAGSREILVDLFDNTYSIAKYVITNDINDSGSYQEVESRTGYLRYLSQNKYPLDKVYPLAKLSNSNTGKTRLVKLNRNQPTLSYVGNSYTLQAGDRIDYFVAFDTIGYSAVTYSSISELPRYQTGVNISNSSSGTRYPADIEHKIIARGMYPLSKDSDNHYRSIPNMPVEYPFSSMKISELISTINRDFIHNTLEHSMIISTFSTDQIIAMLDKVTNLFPSNRFLNGYPGSESTSTSDINDQVLGLKYVRGYSNELSFGLFIKYNPKDPRTLLYSDISTNLAQICNWKEDSVITYNKLFEVIEKDNNVSDLPFNDYIYTTGNFYIDKLKSFIGTPNVYSIENDPYIKYVTKGIINAINIPKNYNEGDEFEQSIAYIGLPDNWSPESSQLRYPNISFTPLSKYGNTNGYDISNSLTTRLEMYIKNDAIIYDDWT